ncbi:hypothetical protein MRS44_015566 [Fusarium solani]|uniref:uncharacterized protein n=1 Tax=Fusarium solani TaxID=169388 RepID=UPI0032C42C16|nr:hypothetical protein MRS44_015566 [Fusarium solani]
MTAEQNPRQSSDEKHTYASQGTIGIDGESGDSSNSFWSKEEEAALLRKVDWLILPILVFGFSTLTLNRSNIAFSLNNGFLQDVGITQNDFNVGQQLLSAGIVIFEIPSNMILYRVGPATWIGFQIIAWSLVGTFQALQTGLGAFIATRLLLGICESGFIPAGLYLMTNWYKTFETGKRFSIYFAGSMAAAALGGLIAFGVSPTDPVSIFGWRYFDERESQILRQRIILDDPTKGVRVGSNVTWGELRRVLTNWRLLPHVITTIAAISPAQGLGTYSPSLVAGMGFSNLSAIAMMTVPPWVLLIGNLSCGFISCVILSKRPRLGTNSFCLRDKLKSRGPVVLVALICNLAFMIANRSMIHSQDGIARFCLLAVGNFFSTSWHPVHGSWLSMNCISEAERSVTMAIHIMGANVAGIVGAQIFRSDDSPPFYPRGWTVILSLVATAVVATLVSNLQYLILNRTGRRPEGSKWKL